MAVTVVLSEVQRAALEALCDTFAASIERDDDATGFWARSAVTCRSRRSSRTGCGGPLPEEQLEGLRQLLDALAAQGLVDASHDAREPIVQGFMDSGPDALAGLAGMRGLTLLFFYALPDEAGQNPNWEAIGYPGPNSPRPPRRRAEDARREAVSGPPATLSADVCVIGSGAGGGVIAGQCAKAGKSVLVLEMGGYHNESDFNQLELPATSSSTRRRARRHGVGIDRDPGRPRPSAAGPS